MMLCESFVAFYELFRFYNHKKMGVREEDEGLPLLRGNPGVKRLNLCYHLRDMVTP
jgi:hypothetical protein